MENLPNLQNRSIQKPNYHIGYDSGEQRYKMIFEPTQRGTTDLRETNNYLRTITTFLVMIFFLLMGIFTLMGGLK